VEVIVEPRSLPGEITAQASTSIKNVVSEVEPELIVWQVGISDALAQADVAAFSDALAEVLTFLHVHRIDVVLVEPPYTAALASDDHFKDIVSDGFPDEPSLFLPSLSRAGRGSFASRQAEPELGDPVGLDPCCPPHGNSH
jgi:hypothetical protein